MQELILFNRTKRKTGQESFHLNLKPLPINLLDFWQWAYSDILTNTNRGKLAEFIVASALDIIVDVKKEWLPYDLITDDGITMEVKSSAYLQNWHQTKLSKIVFNISPKRSWDPSSNKLSDSIKRNSDIYIFCLLDHKEPETLDILNLGQWIFYLLKTAKLNENCQSQKSITLTSLLKLNPIVSDYNSLKNSFKKI